MYTAQTITQVPTPGYTPAQEQEYARQWLQAIQDFNAGDRTALTDGVQLGELRVMSRAGDAPTNYPVITDLVLRDNLRPFELWALDHVAAIVDTTNNRARSMPGMDIYNTGTREKVQRFNPVADRELLITIPLSGGRA